MLINANMLKSLKRLLLYSVKWNAAIIKLLQTYTTQYGMNFWAQKLSSHLKKTLILGF